MECKQCAEDLTAFMDGELDSANADQVRSHLSACIPCSEELRSLRETAAFIESHDRALEPRAGSWNLVQARITAVDQPPSGFWLFSRFKLATAALAIVLVFTLGYLQFQQTQKKNLDAYISRYVQQREAQLKAQQAVVNTEVNSQIENPYADNPFVEIKATVADNPFRSEDQ
jgi:anti-sigma factor RsiW